MSRRPTEKRIERPIEFRALNSERRVEILAAVRLFEPCSVGDIAAHLEREPETLYYHFDILEQAGLLRGAGSRSAGRGVEALYERSADRFRFHPTRRTPRFVESLRKAYRTSIRAAESSLLTATGHPSEVRDGRGKNVRMQLYTLRLTNKDLDELNRRLDAVRSFLLERPQEHCTGQAHRVLLLCSPIVSDES